MELTKELFYSEYDSVVHRLFKPYLDFLKIGAQAIPKDARSICDLGIGTGNFSLAVKRRIPGLKIYGIDQNPVMASVALSKIPMAKIYVGDIFDRPFPKADYFVSSLVTHHFDDKTKRQKLEAIAKGSKGFVNFDIMLFDGYTLDDAIETISGFAQRNFEGDVSAIKTEMKAKDNPMSLEMHREIFEELGLKFEVLAKQAPFAVYSAFWPNKKE